MNSIARRSVLASLLAAAASLTLAAPSFAEEPWEPDPYDTEGVYIITGTGPPNTRVDLVRDGSSLYFPYANDSTLNEGEYTSPSGHFRIDEGFCNPSADCVGGHEKPFRIIFHRFDLDRVPIWAPGSLFRMNGSQAFNLPRRDDVPRTDRVFLTASGPASLPSYTTISGTTRMLPAGGGAATPLADVSVDAYDAGGLGGSALSYPGKQAGSSFSQADGTWSLQVPPGQWALKYRTPIGMPFYPGYIWSGCIIEPSHVPPPPGTPPPAGTSYISTAGTTTGIDLTVGDGGVCNGSTVAPPTDPPVDPPSNGGDPPATGGGPPGTGPSGDPPTAAGPLVASRASSNKNGSATVTVTVPGPGELAAKATGKPPKAGAAQASAAKKITIAKGSATARKAGTVKLVLKPTKAAKRLMAKGYKLKATAKITFKPTSGAAKTISKSLTFKRKPPGAKKKS